MALARDFVLQGLFALARRVSAEIVADEDEDDGFEADEHRVVFERVEFSGKGGGVKGNEDQRQNYEERIFQPRGQISFFLRISEVYFGHFFIL